jgi:hypothetical protein
VKNFGPVGIGITFKPAEAQLRDDHQQRGEGLPAAATGKLKKGQVIQSINGTVLKDKDPRIILGDLITEAEAKDGKIALDIKDLGAVVVTIPVMGEYSKTWPLNCPSPTASSATSPTCWPSRRSPVGVRCSSCSRPARRKTSTSSASG